MTSLRERLSQPAKGDWELLATAAGAVASVESTMRMLSADVLELGAWASGQAPSSTTERVEALAAWNLDALAALATTWKKPKDISDSGWWIAAWLSSLRHLKGLGVVERADVDVPSLSREVSILWDPPLEPGISWESAKVLTATTAFPYDAIRKLDRSVLVDEALSVAHIEDSPPVMLRLLRGRTSLLAPSARNLIAEMGSTCLERSSREAALLMELCKEIAPQVCDDISDQLVKRITPDTDPWSMIPVAYVLLSGWQMP